MEEKSLLPPEISRVCVELIVQGGWVWSVG
jgi:hypothetical protein